MDNIHIGVGSKLKATSFESLEQSNIMFSRFHIRMSEFLTALLGERISFKAADMVRKTFWFALRDPFYQLYRLYCSNTWESITSLSRLGASRRTTFAATPNFTMPLDMTGLYSTEMPPQHLLNFAVWLYVQLATRSILLPLYSPTNLLLFGPDLA